MNAPSGVGVGGVNMATTGNAFGVFGKSSSAGANAAGVGGHESSTAGTVFGVDGETSSMGSFSAGVNGNENATTGQVFGVNGNTASTGNGSAGVNGHEGATTGQVFGVTGSTNSGRARQCGRGKPGSKGRRPEWWLWRGAAESTNSTTQGAAGMSAFEGAATGGVFGIIATTTSVNGTGVLGNSVASSGFAVGVEGKIVSPKASLGNL